jgi:vesicle-associated membrane protein 4
MESSRQTHKIKYVFIGNVKNSATVLDYVVSKNEKSIAECKRILDRLSMLQELKYNQRNKIGAGGESVYYFTIIKYDEESIFFLVETVNNYPERSAFGLIDEIVSADILKLHNNTSKREELKKLIDKYESETLIANISADIKEIKDEIKIAIGSQISNMENLETLKGKSENIKLGADAYRKDAKELERVTWWQNCKLTVIIIAVIILLILVIVLPIVLTQKSSNSSNPTTTL